MKNRYTAPFGYTIIKGITDIKGITEIQPDEGGIVAQIFENYLAGDSYQIIAEHLSTVNIEFLPGRSDWDKHRVKRTLGDCRYTGVSGFPALISEDLYERVRGRIFSKNTQRSIEQKKNISMHVRCLKCGEKMKRLHDARLKISEFWTCPCGAKIRIGDADLRAVLTEILNRLIERPNLVEDEPAEEQEMPLNLVAMQNEINRQLEGFGFDRDRVKASIFELAALKYNQLDNRKNTTKQLRAELERMAPLSVFSPEALVRVAGQILMSEPDVVQIKLKNGQIIGKDEINECDSDSAKASVHATGGAPAAECGGLCPRQHGQGGTGEQLRDPA